MSKVEAKSEVQAFEILEVDSVTPSCDGGNGALGHPRVTFRIKPEVGVVTCPYCSRQYRLKAGAKVGGGH
ncbi:MAG: zinc-finger domain-containing protein [Alphaproteobacteria bacterium]|nr:zinc-finger domain-containing protein [Alphaproteobacteria bacterium]